MINKLIEKVCKKCQVRVNEFAVCKQTKGMLIQCYTEEFTRKHDSGKKKDLTAENRKVWTI